MGSALLTDFGSTVELYSTRDIFLRPLSEWIPPEMRQVDNGRLPNVTCQADIYAFGVLCMEVSILLLQCLGRLTRIKVATGSVPSIMERNLFHAVPRTGASPPIGDVDRNVSMLIRDCWSLDPSLRPSAGAIIYRLEALIKSL